jgi:hypothetical protein
MRPLDMSRIWAPSSGFETRRVEKRVVDSYETFTHAILDCVEIVGAKLVGYQTVD